ncbi:MAG: helix-hairpin-helix domain-containing protein [Defluviitaleaceae bacterium]|nr:helix-hairpin-helix domain-containing protein [Defluviitaleaceae bacterium]
MDFVKRYAYVFLGVLCALALGGLFIVNSNRPSGVMDLGQNINEPRLESTPPPQEPQAEPEINNVVPTEPDTIMVHIVGAVYSPGVFEVPYGSRVNDVLYLAGGHTYEADLALINLAAFVHDAMQIRIPVVGDPMQVLPGDQPSAGTTTSGTNSDGLININLASFTELQTLPGIGPVMAQSIIDYRESNNGFSRIEDLLNVSGIGPARFENIRERITIER